MNKILLYAVVVAVVALSIDGVVGPANQYPIWNYGLQQHQPTINIFPNTAGAFSGWPKGQKGNRRHTGPSNIPVITTKSLPDGSNIIKIHPPPVRQQQPKMQAPQWINGIPKLATGFPPNAPAKPQPGPGFIRKWEKQKKNKQIRDEYPFEKEDGRNTPWFAMFNEETSKNNGQAQKAAVRPQGPGSRRKWKKQQKGNKENIKRKDPVDQSALPFEKEDDTDAPWYNMFTEGDHTATSTQNNQVPPTGTPTDGIPVPASPSINQNHQGEVQAVPAVAVPQTKQQTVPDPAPTLPSIPTSASAPAALVYPTPTATDNQQREPTMATSNVHHPATVLHPQIHQ